MNTTTKTDPLESLAQQADNLPPPLGEGVTEADVSEREEQEREQQQADEGMRQMEGMVAGMVTLGLKFGRRLMAQKLPEVEETLPDSTLATSAQSALPLIRKYAGGLMETAAKSPELAALLVGMMPIALGIVAAIDLHERRAASTPPPAPTPLPEVPAE